VISLQRPSNGYFAQSCPVELLLEPSQGMGGALESFANQPYFMMFILCFLCGLLQHTSNGYFAQSFMELTGLADELANSVPVLILQEHLLFRRRKWSGYYTPCVEFFRSVHNCIK
jgi:hypothetical protein